MRSKSIILLALALGCGLVASIGISQVMERRNQPTVARGEMVPVFVAMHDLNPNDPITAQNVKIEEWPKDKVQEGAITKIEELENMRARHKLFAGEQIVDAKIINADDMTSSSHIIPMGYRVVAVRVDAVSGSAGLIVPGDRVDVLVFLNKNPAQGVMETTTKTILQNIRVFAVDTTVIRNPESAEATAGAKTISLLVTPQQAEKVTLASELGAIRLVLRNDQEQGTIESSGTEANDVFGGAGNRHAEQGRKPSSDQAADMMNGASQGFKSLLDMIKEQKKQVQAAAPPDNGPFKMMVIKGAEVEEMQIEGDGLAVVVGETGQPTSPPATPSETAPPAEEPSDFESEPTPDPFPADSASDSSEFTPHVSLAE